MKKIILFVLLFICLVGCSNPSSKKSDLDILNELADTISFPEEVSSNLNFNSLYQYENINIFAEWLSDDETIISNEGVVVQTQETNYVSVILNLKLNNELVTKVFDFIVLPISSDVYAQHILNTIEIPSIISDHITLSNFTKYEDKNYKISWKSKDETILSNRGKVTFNPTDKNVVLEATISYGGYAYSKEFNITVKAFNIDGMNDYLNNLEIPSAINSSIYLPTSTDIDSKNFNIQWTSSNPDVLSNKGELNIVLDETSIILTATISIDNVSVSKDFNILVHETSEEEITKIILNSLYIPTVTASNLYLPTNLNNFSGIWQSENENLIKTNGEINTNINAPTSTTLTYKITIGEKTMTFNFDTIIQPVKHFYMNDVFNGEKENLIINSNGHLELEEGKTSGTYYSEEIETHNFSEAVATWCAITSTKATCELFVSLKVNNTFSDYITYGEWGLGLKNGSRDQTNSLIKLVDDEIMVLNNKYASGFKFKLVLKRTSSNDESPIVDLVTFALNLVNYSYDVDSSLLKKCVKYDVPELYQHAVPNIGNIICSITSSTMLLKYKGYSFIDKNPLEHEYLAGLFYDHSNSIYGNWVFNCVGMSSYGERAYVKRFFSTNEFLYSLQEIGPMAASIKGTVKYTNMKTNSEGSYTTAGHLLVVTGYEITNSETYIFINDPNVNGVSIRMTLANFLAIWRNVSYILEY